MLTRTLNNSVAILLAGLVAGLLSQSAAANEEVVAYASETAAEIEARETRLQSELKDYAQSLNRDMKVTLDKALKRVAAPKLELAAAEIPTRG